MKLYLSGNFVYLSANKKQSNYDSAKLNLIASGINSENIVSPHDLQLPIVSDFLSQLNFRFHLMDTCDSIYMLRNWKESIESRHELTKAYQKGFNIYYENHQDNSQNILNPK